MAEAQLELNIDDALASVDQLNTAFDDVVNGLSSSLDNVFTNALDPQIADISTQLDDAAAGLGSNLDITSVLDPQIADISSQFDNLASTFPDQINSAFQASPIDLNLDTTAVDGATNQIDGLSSSIDTASAASEGASGKFGGMEGVTAGLETATAGLEGSMGGLFKTIIPGAAIFGGITLAISSLIEKADAAELAAHRLAQVFGSAAPTVFNTQLSGLKSTLQDLTTRSGASTAGLQQQVATFGQLAVTSGASREEAAKQAKQMGELASIVTILNPALGTSDKNFQTLSRGLAGSTRILQRYGIAIDPAKQKILALASAHEHGRAVANTYDKEVAGSTLALQALELQAKKDGTTLQDELNKGLNSSTLQFRALKGEITTTLQQIGAPLIQAGLAIAKALTPILLEIIQLFGKLAAIILPALVPIANIIGKTLFPIFLRIIDFSTKVTKAFVGFVSPGVIAFFHGLADGISAAIDAISAIYGWLKDKLTPLFDTVRAKVHGLGINFGEFFTAVGKVAGVALTIALAFKGVSLAISGIQAALKLLALDPVVLAFIALGTALVILYQNSAAFRDVVKQVGDFINKNVLPAIDNFIKALQNNLGPALDAVGRFFSTVFSSETATKVFDAIKSAAQGLADFLTGIFDSIKSAWHAVQDAFNGGLSVGQGGGTIALLKDSIQGLVQFVANNPLVAIFTAASVAAAAFALVSIPQVDAALTSMFALATAGFSADAIIAGIGGVVTAFGALATLIPDTIAAFELFGGAVAGVGAALAGEGGIAAALSELVAGFGLLAGGPIIVIIAGLVALGAAFAALYFNVQPVRDLVDNFVSSIGDSIGKVVSSVAPALDQLAGTFDKLSPQIERITSALVGAVSTAITPFIIAISAIASVTNSLLGPAFRFFTDVVITAFTSSILFIRGALDVIIGIIALFIDVITLNWGGAWDDIKTVVEGVWLVIQSIVNLGLGAIEAPFHLVLGVIRALWDDLWGALSGVVGEVWAAITSIVTDNLNSIKAFLQGGLDAIVAIWNGTWAVLSAIVRAVFGVVSQFITKTINDIKTTISTVLNAIVALWQTEWRIIVTIVTTYIHIVQTIISSVLNAIRAVWDAAWNGLRSVVSAVFGAVRSIISGEINTVKSIVSGGISGIVGFFASLGSRILSAIGNVAGILVSVGQSIIDGLVQGIKNAWHKVEDTITGLADHLPGVVKDVLGIGSPSKVFADVGNEIPAGLALGIANGQGQAEAAVVNMSDSVTKAGKDALKQFGDSASQITQPFVDTLPKISDAFTSLGSSAGIGDFTKALTDTTTSVTTFTTNLQTVVADNLPRTAALIASLGPKAGAQLAAQLAAAGPQVQAGFESMLGGAQTALDKAKIAIVNATPAFSNAGVNLGTSIGSAFGRNLTFADVTVGAIGRATVEIAQDRNMPTQGLVLGDRVTNALEGALNFAGVSDGQLSAAETIFNTDRALPASMRHLSANSSIAFEQALKITHVSNAQIIAANNYARTGDVSGFTALGINMVNGVKGPLESAGGVWGKAMSTSIDTAMAQAKAIIQANSPSRLTRDQIGVPLSEGIEVGILDGKDAIANAAVGVLHNAIDEVSNETFEAAHLGIGSPIAAGIAQGITDGIPKIHEALGGISGSAQLSGSLGPGAGAVGSNPGVLAPVTVHVTPDKGMSNGEAAAIGTQVGGAAAREIQAIVRSI